MRVIGLSDVSLEEIDRELDRGARFVRFHWVLSWIVFSLSLSSRAHFVRPGDSTLRRSWPFSVVTLIFGWWALPSGPIHTISALSTNLRGGEDVTGETFAELAGTTACPHCGRVNSGFARICPRCENSLRTRDMRPK